MFFLFHVFIAKLNEISSPVKGDNYGSKQTIQHNKRVTGSAFSLHIGTGISPYRWHERKSDVAVQSGHQEN
jgi:hypothetical protein